MNIMSRVKIFHTCSIGQRQEGCWGEGSESHGWLVSLLLSPVSCGGVKAQTNTSTPIIMGLNKKKRK